jgi:hypothetical protein
MRKVCYVILFNMLLFSLNADNLKNKEKLEMINNAMSRIDLLCAYNIAFDCAIKINSQAIFCNFAIKKELNNNSEYEEITFYFNSFKIPSILKLFGREVFDIIIAIETKTYKIIRKDSFYSGSKGYIEPLKKDITDLLDFDKNLPYLFQDIGLYLFLEKYNNVNFSISLSSASNESICYQANFGNISDDIKKNQIYYFTYFDNNLEKLSRWCTDEDIRSKIGMKTNN